MPGLPTWMQAPRRAPRPDGRGKKLTIVVPYRDREAHLCELLPAMQAYFLRSGDPCLWPLPRICVVEQADAGRFNRGMLCNIGFALHHHDLDYVCLHDVDCVPLDVDYSYADLPSRLISEGTRQQENPQVTFGAVVALSKADFQRVNGFSNLYAGWGYEDVDLLLRIVRAGMTLEARVGIFRSLPHQAAEFDASGQLRPEVQVNQQRVLGRFETTDAFWSDDGLSSLRYDVIDSTIVSAASASTLEVLHHRVRLS